MEFVSLHEVLAVGGSALVHSPAEYEGEVDGADSVAVVEDRDGQEGCDCVDQLCGYEDDLGLDCLWLEGLSWAHDVESPHDTQHQLVHPVVSVPCQTSQGKLQVLIGGDPGGQDDLDSEEVEELPEDIEHHGQHE